MQNTSILSDKSEATPAADNNKNDPSTVFDKIMEAVAAPVLTTVLTDSIIEVGVFWIPYLFSDSRLFSLK